LFPTLNEVLTSELLRAGSTGRMAAARIRSRARAWVGVAQGAIELYGDRGAIPFADVAAELATEIRLLRAALAEQRPHQQARERAWLQVELDQLARTLPGIAQVGAPLLVAAIGPQMLESLHATCGLGGRR
jgi:hypothetical protein